MSAKTRGRKEGGRRKEEGRRTSYIKSNNPHLTGGEKHSESSVILCDCAIVTIAESMAQFPSLQVASVFFFFLPVVILGFSSCFSCMDQTQPVPKDRNLLHAVGGFLITTTTWFEGFCH